jgi:hypothetical protein
MGAMKPLTHTPPHLIRCCAREALGAEVYGSMGIDRGDAEGRREAVLRNYEFFGAPVVGIVCIHTELGPADVLSVGMYLQTLLLALTARGISTCVQVRASRVLHARCGLPRRHARTPLALAVPYYCDMPMPLPPAHSDHEHVY